MSWNISKYICFDTCIRSNAHAAVAAAAAVAVAAKSLGIHKEMYKDIYRYIDI